MKMTHPASGQVIEVLDGSEGRYIKNGWRPVKATTKKSGSRAPESGKATDPVEGD